MIKPMQRTFVFVLCPPYQGSTLIVNLLNSSDRVSTLLGCSTWAGEAQWLYKNHGDAQYVSNRWKSTYQFDPTVLEHVLNCYMDHKKPIWVEKSPSHICRAKQLQDHFSRLGKVYFIVSIRNPYSWDGREYMNQWVTMARYQKHNIENLNNVIPISYEECCCQLDRVVTKITSSIPEIGHIFNNQLLPNPRMDERFQYIHDSKINRVIQKQTKNVELSRNIDLLRFFGYDLI